MRLLLAFLLPLVCLGAAAQSPQQSATPNLAGKVELVEGDVTVHDRAKKPRKVAVGDTILEGEGIVTGKDGELHLNMEDGGFIAVRPNTKMRIVAYQAQGDEGDKGVFSLLQGTFRSVTGWIGRFNPRSYQVRTPTATIGVRGTDHEPLVIPQGSKEGEPGSYDKVNVGGSFIQTQHGSVDVKPNQAAFVPLHGRPVPRVLPQVPQFFRATRHEAIIAARHDAIHKVLDQRRDERRKVFQEKKSLLEKQKTERQKLQQDRKRQWQENRQKRQPEQGLHQREDREKRQAGAEERRKRIEDRREMRQPERDGRGRDRDHGPRGGGRGRD
ncbi:MAG: FecR domain-containing protein [Rhodocyclales bacterium]|nr:FecR domain-containing protein [Rhodocyclales bacterium]